MKSTGHWKAERMKNSCVHSGNSAQCLLFPFMLPLHISFDSSKLNNSDIGANISRKKKSCMYSSGGVNVLITGFNSMLVTFILDFGDCKWVLRLDLDNNI